MLSLAPVSSNGSGRPSRPVLGFASRQSGPALGGAGVTNGGDGWECAAEEEKEKPKDKGREPALDGRKE